MAASADKKSKCDHSNKSEIVGTKHRAFDERLESGGKAAPDRRHTVRIVVRDPRACKEHLHDRALSDGRTAFT
jgi:hypothetical protein